MSEKTAYDLVPDVPLVANLAEAERRCYENFKILSDLLVGGVGITKSFVVDGTRIGVTNGVITRITTAT